MIATASISTVIRIGLMILFILALFGMGRLLDAYLALHPNQIWPGLQFWRMVTYPVALNAGGLLIGAVAFSQPGEEIESMLGRRRFGAMLLIVTLLSAAIHLLVFFGQMEPRLSGPQNVSLFVMVGYVYLFPASSVRIIFFNIRSKILLLLMVLLVAAVSVYRIDGGESILVFLSEGGAGLVLGALWFHLTYQKYPVLLGPIRAMSGGARISVRKKQKQRSGVLRPAVRMWQDDPDDAPERTISDEERLDAILEQIGRKGVESLSPEDRRFLDEYSSRL